MLFLSIPASNSRWWRTEKGPSGDDVTSTEISWLATRNRLYETAQVKFSLFICSFKIDVSLKRSQLTTVSYLIVGTREQLPLRITAPLDPWKIPLGFWPWAIVRWLTLFTIFGGNPPSSKSFFLRNNKNKIWYIIIKITLFANILCPFYRFDERKGYFCYSTKEGDKPRCLGASKGRQYPPLSEETRQDLSRFYRPFNVALDRLLTKHGYRTPTWLQRELATVEHWSVGSQNLANQRRGDKMIMEFGKITRSYHKSSNTNRNYYFFNIPLREGVVLVGGL